LKGGATAHTGRERRWRIAIAASVVVSLMTLGLSLVLPMHRTDQPGSARLDTTRTLIAAPRIVRLGSVRGLGSSPDVIMALNAAPSELILEPDVVVLTCEDGAIELECTSGGAPQTPQYSEYEMELVNRRNSTLAWRSSRQLPVNGSRLSFDLHDPGTLEAGDYDMIVRGHSPDHEEVVARFWLRIQAQ